MKSWVWKYAQRQGDKAYCNLCIDEVNNEFSCRGGSTGSLMRHLEGIHGLSKNQIQSPQKRRSFLNLTTMDSQAGKDDADLKNLLASWSLGQHYEHFVRENIKIKHLRLIQPKLIDKLFQNLPTGDQVLFETHLQIWKLTMALNNDLNNAPAVVPTTNKTMTNGKVSTSMRECEDSTDSVEIMENNSKAMDLLVAMDNSDVEFADVEAKNNGSVQNIHLNTPNTRAETRRSEAAPVTAPIESTAKAVATTTTTTTPLPAVTQRDAASDGVRSTSSYTNGMTCRYDLMHILMQTTCGQSVFNYYEQHKHLREEHRSTLINVVARYINAHGSVLSLQETNRLENKIVELFPNEKLEFYRTNRKGRLYNKVANMKRTHKKIESFTKLATNAAAKRQASPAPPVEIKEEEYMDDYNDFMINDLREKATANGDFGFFWKYTQTTRVKQIDEIESLQDILEKWPEYQDPRLIIYISNDFFFKYPSATKFSQVFNDNKEKLENLLFSKVHTSSAAYKTLQLYQDASKESQNLLILWAIHQLFPPNQHIVTDEHGVKHKRRYSVTDSQGANFFIRKSMAQIDDYLENKESSTPPMLLIVGELGVDIKEIQVYFEGVRFPMKSIVQAAEFCLELYFLFNIDFPEKSVLVYNFMQTFFLNIEPEIKNSKIYTTINELRLG